MYGVCSGVDFCRLGESVCTWQYQLLLTMCLSEKCEMEENMCFEVEFCADFCLTMTAMTFSTMWRRLIFFVFLSFLGVHRLSLTFGVCLCLSPVSFVVLVVELCVIAAASG